MPDLNKTPIVVVDPQKCVLNAICAGLAPVVFEIDDDDVLVVHQPDSWEENAAAVRQAVSSCPNQALSLRAAG